jgi:histidinol-phosphate/aromatic aminotransferase/cobyric acid decarboxylase-like protein
VRFPLADWIDSHPECRHNLATSGMVGSVRHPTPTPREVRTADPEELRRSLAGLVGVDRRRVFLTHGATEANSAVLFYLARRSSGHRGRVRVKFPEYPSLPDAAREAGFEVTETPGPATVALVSQPRNPEGDLWPGDRIWTWAEGAEHVLVDETFREFASSPSLLREDLPNLWATGTFTKFFAGDDIRVGFLVAPEPEAAGYGRFHGVVLDQIADYSVAAALACLRARGRIRRDVDRILRVNRTVWRAAFPGEPVPVAPVGFDRHGAPDGDTLAQRCLAASVLVCPGGLFGDPRGVRLGLTHRRFPEDLAAYLAVRDAGISPSTRGRSTRTSSPRPARPPRAESDRGRAARG